MWIKYLSYQVFNFIISVSILLIFFISCGTEEYHPGRDLSVQYCSSCHLFPEPDLLDSATWADHVLPKMGGRLGMQMSKAEIAHTRLLQSLAVAPPGEALSMENWMTIKDFYLNTSPKTLNSTSEGHMDDKTLDLFEASPILVSPAIRSASMIDFHHETKMLYIGDGLNYQLYRYDFTSQTTDSFATNGAPAKILLKDSLPSLVLSMGRMPPNDLTEGKVLSFSDRNTIGEISIIDGLRRPVDMEWVIEEVSGDTSLLVSSFGNILGNLSLFRISGDTVKEKVLLPEPGSLGGMTIDLDYDGLKDILTLMGQGREGFYWFKNLGNGEYTPPQALLAFPASNGSSYFDTLDFNGDGLLDILYCNGDNGDYPPVMKPYHGIRVYLRQPGNAPEFKESLFLPLNGVYGAKVADFDNDGDLDIAALSYFPDYNEHPEEGFVLFLNVENKFVRCTGEIGLLGKWLVMDAADFDDDGDLDIILGSSNMMTGDVPDSIRSKWEQVPSSIYLLKNKTY